MESPIDWSVTTFEGSRREQYRHWRKLPLEAIIRSLEEMDELTREWAQTPAAREHKDTDA